MKLNSLLDKVSDQMLERFEKRPGEFSNDDLLSYMNTVQASIDRANKSLQLIDQTPPAIQINQVNITNEDPVLSRESREKVDNVIKILLNKLNLEKKEVVDVNPEVIEDTQINETNNDN